MPPTVPVPGARGRRVIEPPTTAVPCTSSGHMTASLQEEPGHEEDVVVLGELQAGGLGAGGVGRVDRREHGLDLAAVDAAVGVDVGHERLVDRYVRAEVVVEPDRLERLGVDVGDADLDGVVGDAGGVAGERLVHHVGLRSFGVDWCIGAVRCFGALGLRVGDRVGRLGVGRCFGTGSGLLGGGGRVGCVVVAARRAGCEQPDGDQARTGQDGPPRA